MRADRAAALCGLAVSPVGVPTALGYLLSVGAPPPPGSAAFAAVGGVATLPGFLLGAVGLWTAARG